jgi:hypothetical protein
MARKHSPLPLLVSGALITAVLCTVLVKGGWLISIPVLLALLVTWRLGGTPGR